VRRVVAVLSIAVIAAIAAITWEVAPGIGARRVAAATQALPDYEIIPFHNYFIASGYEYAAYKIDRKKKTISFCGINFNVDGSLKEKHCDAGLMPSAELGSQAAATQPMDAMGGTVTV
jgi:hypothetical protein